MHITSRATRVLILAATLVLSACGFQLRGSHGTSMLPFKTIYVALPDTSLLGTELRRYIRASGDTTIAPNEKEAQATIQILSENRNRAILSLNTQGRIREYSLYYILRFRVVDNKGKELLPPTDISLRRDMSYNESQELTKEKEEEIQYRDMQSDAVQHILRRLAALKPV